MADIIVTDVTPRVQYTAGGGSPTVFSYPFPIFEDTDLNVYLTPVGATPNDVTQILTYNVDYTVTNSAPPTVGGTITLTVGATAGDVITIVRNQPDNRLNNYVDGGLFQATDVNTDFDRTVFMNQQQKMYDQVVGVHYNLSAQPVAVTDTVLPVLGPNEVWVKDNAGTAITTYDISGGGGGVVNSVTGTANRITASPTTGHVIVDISASYVGQASITTLGTITTGTWNGSVVGSAYGGTGFSTYTLGDIIYCSAANVLSKLAGNTTVAKQYLSQTGDGVNSAAPVWSTISGGDITGAALTRVNDTNVTLTLGGSPTDCLLKAASITVGWSGQLPNSRGGTGTGTAFTQGSVVFAGAAGVYSQDNANFFWDDTNNRLGIGTNSPSYDLHINRSATGSAVAARVQNSDSGNVNSDAHMWLRTATGGGNPHFVVQVDAAQAYAFGIDQADSSKFKLSRSTAVATNTVLTITSAGAATFAGSLAADSLTLTNPLTVPYGGTGLATATTAYGVVCAGTTATGAFQVLNSLGTAGQVLTSNGAGALPSWQAGGSGSGTDFSRSISQAAHGFAVGDVVYLNGTTYTKAIATSAAAAEATGIVSVVTDANTFTLLFGGRISTLSGLTAGEVYFLSASTAGLLTTTPPSTVGQYVKPLLIADTTTSGYFFNMRGNEVTANAGVPAATQAEQETATSTVTYVSPGRQQFHPSASKAWVSYTSVTTTTILSSYNVTSLTDNGTGDTTINLTTAFSSANYGITTSCLQGAASNIYGCVVKNGTTPTASAMQMITFNGLGNAADTIAYVACFGDQ